MSEKYIMPSIIITELDISLSKSGKICFTVSDLEKDDYTGTYYDANIYVTVDKVKVLLDSIKNKKYDEKIVLEGTYYVDFEKSEGNLYELFFNENMYSSFKTILLNSENTKKIIKQIEKVLDEE